MILTDHFLHETAFHIPGRNLTVLSCNMTLKTIMFWNETGTADKKKYYSQLGNTSRMLSLQV